MLKKVLLLLLTLCLLPLTVYADASRLHEYVGPCPHQLCNFGVVLENAADAIGEVSDGSVILRPTYNKRG
jgi:hypothetical protein